MTEEQHENEQPPGEIPGEEAPENTIDYEAVKQQMEAERQERQKEIQEQLDAIKVNNEPARMALQALRDGEPLQNETI